MLLKDLSGGTVEEIMVEGYATDIGKIQGVVAVKGIDGTVEEAVMVGFLFAGVGAVPVFIRVIAPYSKKEPSPCCFVPVMGILYLSMKYWGSTSKYWRSIRSSSRCSAGE